MEVTVSIAADIAASVVFLAGCFHRYNGYHGSPLTQTGLFQWVLYNKDLWYIHTGEGHACMHAVVTTESGYYGNCSLQLSLYIFKGLPEGHGIYMHWGYRIMQTIGITGYPYNYTGRGGILTCIHTFGFWRLPLPRFLSPGGCTDL